MPCEAYSPVMASASAGPRNCGSTIVDHHAEKSAERLGHRVVARTVGVGAARAEATDGAVHEPRVDLQQLFNARPETFRGSGPEILDVDVGLADETLEELAVRALLHVERHAALVAVIGLKVRRVLTALVGAVGVALGAFDLDDVGAEVRQHHPGARTGDEGALLDHANACQCRCRILHASALLARLEPGRGIPVVADRLGRRVRHDEADGALLLLEQVRRPDPRCAPAAARPSAPAADTRHPAAPPGSPRRH